MQPASTFGCYGTYGIYGILTISFPYYYALKHNFPGKLEWLPMIIHLFTHFWPA